MTTAPTFIALNDTTIQVHAPGYDVEPMSPGGPDALILDAAYRLRLGWITRTDSPDTYTLTHDPEADPIGIAAANYDDHGIPQVYADIPGVNYVAPEDATTEQVAADLNKHAAAALEWAAQGYPAPTAA